MKIIRILFDVDNWKEIFHTLGKNKWRTVLTAFGVFWGILMLIILLGAGIGLKNGITNAFEGTATNSFFVWATATTEPYMGLPKGRRFNFTLDDAEAIRGNISEISNLAPRIMLSNLGMGVNVTHRGETGAFSVSGDFPDYFNVIAYKQTDGRVLNQLDIKEKRKVAVIGKRVVESLFPHGGEPIGSHLKINGVYFEIVGVVEERGGQSVSFGDIETSIFLPFTTFQQAYNTGGTIHYFAVTSQENLPASIAAEKVIEFLKVRHKVAPKDERAIGHFNLEEIFNEFQGLSRGIIILIWIVGTGTLIAGVIGISNIMLILVKERTNEIGVRRALGATPADIIRQIILESVVLTIIAGYVGMILGLLILNIMEQVMGDDGFLNPHVDIKVALSAIAILVISGALAGMIPAQRAVKVHPVEALRS